MRRLYSERGADFLKQLIAARNAAVAVEVPQAAISAVDVRQPSRLTRFFDLAGVSPMILN